MFGYNSIWCAILAKILGTPAFTFLWCRTVLSEKQLNILKTCYRWQILLFLLLLHPFAFIFIISLRFWSTFSPSSANPRPDALMKEQLTEMTGLSPRVIRVWFQNKRCKVTLSTFQQRNILKILLKFFKDKKIQNRMIEKQLQGEKVDTQAFLFCI